jgi:hypothetical protein
MVVKSDSIGISKVRIGANNKFIWAAQGMIFNASDEPIYDARVELRITDLSNQSVVTREVNTSLIGTMPGQVNPFRYTDTAFPTLPRVAVEARLKDFSTSYTATLRNLEIVSYTPHLVNCIAWCLGSVSVQARNPYTSTLSNVRLLVWTNDSFCGPVSSIPISQSLMPGAIVSYTWEFCPSENVLYPTSDLYIVAQGEVPP